MAVLTTGPADLALPLDAYRAWLATIPAHAREALLAAHGAPDADPAFSDGAFRFRAVRDGALTIALQPPRDATPDRKARYHDPDAPPSHGYLAFYLALRQSEAIDALIHLGTHGTTEWLPGKAVALSASCWPRLVTQGLPVVYPYVVDDPGEAAPAKRRLSAVTLGHLPPPLSQSAVPEGMARLERLLDEYSTADGLDPARRDRLIADIRDEARASGVEEDLGIPAQASAAEAITRIDRFVCDIKESLFGDGLHVLGQGACGPSEQAGLSAALAGKRVPPGPSGSPARGRTGWTPWATWASCMHPRPGTPGVTNSAPPAALR